MSDKPCLVFAHYFGGSARSWAPLVGALAGEFECIVPDLPGFGGTAALAPDPSLDGYEAAFAALAPPRPWIAVGHSMGGKIALAAALRRPAGLAGLILIAPSPPTPEPMTPDDRRQTLASFGDVAAARAHFEEITEHTLSPEQFAACVADELAVDQIAWDWWLERGSRDDISGATATLTLPVLVLAGDNDTVLGPDTAPGVAARLAGARLEIVASAGHLVPLERADAVAAAVRRFAGGL